MTAVTDSTRTAREAAAQAAVGFLLRRQSPEGAWTDFLLPAGQSTLWVTAFVGGILGGRPEPEAREAAQAAWRFLEPRETAEGGWGYNAKVPGDADSTLWGLRLAAVLGLSGAPAARRAATFLERHVRADGGLATYATAEAVRAYIGLPPVISFQGWLQSHVCVTAAGANLPGLGERFLPALASAQAADGRWPAYWWFDDEYATAEAVAALAGPGRTAADCEPGTAARIDRAAAWLLTRVDRLLAGPAVRPPAFALAHALRVLARAAGPAGTRDALARGLAQLVAWQGADGSWPASARLRVPRPDCLVPDPEAAWVPWAGLPPGPVDLEKVLRHTFTNYSLDRDGVYSTATALGALQDAAGLAG